MLFRVEHATQLEHNLDWSLINYNGNLITHAAKFDERKKRFLGQTSKPDNHRRFFLSTNIFFSSSEQWTRVKATNKFIPNFFFV